MVSLGTTLINLNTRTLLIEGMWSQIFDRLTNGTDIFIGAIVTQQGETRPDIDLCAEDQSILGIVLGYVPQLETIDTQGYYYRDYDVPFGDNKWVRVGQPAPNSVVLLLTGTNVTIALGEPLKVVDGVISVASTGDQICAYAEEAVTGASNTRKYFKARWVKTM